MKKKIFFVIFLACISFLNGQEKPHKKTIKKANKEIKKSLEVEKKAKKMPKKGKSYSKVARRKIAFAKEMRELAIWKIIKATGTNAARNIVKLLKLTRPHIHLATLLLEKIIEEAIEAEARRKDQELVQIFKKVIKRRNNYIRNYDKDIAYDPEIEAGILRGRSEGEKYKINPKMDTVKLQNLFLQFHKNEQWVIKTLKKSDQEKFLRIVKTVAKNAP